MMWRRLTAVLVIGLLLTAPLTGALARKPRIAGKGTPTLWGDPGIPGPSLGDPDWPAFSRESEDRQRVSVKFTDPGSLGREPSTSPGRSVTAIGRESWWSSFLFELRIQGLTIVTWRR
jgi:hypothetical protein